MSVIMGGYLKPLPRLCPKSEHMYTVKMQEFETYARRDIRIEAVIIAPELDALIGGLVSPSFCLACFSNSLNSSVLCWLRFQSSAALSPLIELSTVD